MTVAPAAKLNARCSPLANGCSISFGKNDRPVTYAAWRGDRCWSAPVGPSSSLMGLYPRNAENKLPIGGSLATRWAAEGATPAATSPRYRWLGSREASPSVTMVKNRPMDSTVAEFWKVLSIPAPAPRCSGGRLFMTAAWLGEKDSPMATANTKMRTANRTQLNLIGGSSSSRKLAPETPRPGVANALAAQRPDGVPGTGAV